MKYFPRQHWQTQSWSWVLWRRGAGRPLSPPRPPSTSLAGSRDREAGKIDSFLSQNLDPYWHSWENKHFILMHLKSQSTKVRQLHPPSTSLEGQQKSRSWENWSILVTKILTALILIDTAEKINKTEVKAQKCNAVRQLQFDKELVVVWFDPSFRSFSILCLRNLTTKLALLALIYKISAALWYLITKSKISAAIWYLIRQSRLSAVEGCNLRDKISNLASEQGSGTFLRKWNDQYWFSCFFL